MELIRRTSEEAIATLGRVQERQRASAVTTKNPKASVSEMLGGLRSDTSVKSDDDAADFDEQN